MHTKLLIKRTARLLAVLVYFTIAVFCIVIAIKPGASIFYAKQVVVNGGMIADSGYAYRFRLDKSPLIYKIYKAYLYEDGQQLTPNPGNVVVDDGNGSYAVIKSSEGIYYLYFSSTDNSNPIINGRTYTLYLPYTFISRGLGIFYFLILLPGLIWFLIFTLVRVEQRSELLQSPESALVVLDRFFIQTGEIIQGHLKRTWPLITAKVGFWEKLLLLTILSSYLYVFFEWIFFITMPSFMSIIKFPAKLEVFFLSGLAFSIVCIIATAVFVVIDIIGALLRIPRITQYLGVLIPTTILAAIGLLLIDNFTYTVLKFGISTSSGLGRVAYTVLFSVLMIYIYWLMLKPLGMREKPALDQRMFNRVAYFALGMLVISVGIAAVKINPATQSRTEINSESQADVKLPNILLLGSDGLSAQNISVYGYWRDTTPRLRQLAESSLVAENAFPNSGNSPGSVISIFTGKLPTTTRVGFTPDILQGEDAFEHLPGILKTEGYSSYELGMPLYVDSYAFNLQNGFDIVNGRSQKSNFVGTFMQEMGYDEAAYFINRITERISDRLLDILFIRKMENPYIRVTNPANEMDDQQKIDQALDFFDQSKQPWFIHIHLLGTHGHYFELQDQVFSKGEEQDQEWMTDFYDDAILSFDTEVGEVIDHLKANGQFDNTILIIYTDHAMQWQVNERIPLMIHFPNGDDAGRINQNVQNLDIAPTILDYLGVQEPEWMAGESLLGGNLASNRLIFSAYAGRQGFDENNVWALKPYIYNPPFYQFDYINVINCQRWYKLDFHALTWEEGEVVDSTTTCTNSDMLSFEAIKQATSEQLVRDGFDISSLP